MKKLLKQKLLVILGPTASGKSDLAVYLAKKYNGEVISADSRQVYRGLDIGTGKITRREMRGIPHHVLNVASPRGQFSVARFKRLAQKAIAAISRRGKLPILCGGTGLYIDALLGTVAIPDVPPDKILRKKLERESPEKLFSLLKKLDPKRARSIDQHNKRRIIRAIEIAKHRGASPLLKKNPLPYRVLKIGIALPDALLRERIHTRLAKRLRHGMIAEVKRLKEKGGLSWKRLDALGLEYRFVAQFLQGKFTKQEMAEKLETAIWRYAKRQKTWFKRDKEIVWVGGGELKRTEGMVKNFCVSTPEKI